MSYGYCPICGARGINRERRINGNDTCEKGHKYPSRDSLPSPDYLSPAAAKFKAQRDELLVTLKEIAEHTDPDSPTENYRADDREGCLDTVFSLARAAIAKAEGGAA